MNDEPIYGATKAVIKVPKRPLCPKCLNEMRLVDDGWLCPRHGINEVKAETKN